MTARSDNKETNTIRQVLLDVLTFGYDTGQGRDEPRGFNINDAERALTQVLEALVEVEWQKRAKPALENHDRLVRRLNELEAKMKASHE